ncbi:MAG: hypothetical protein HS103_00595 [Anaerolineales bacterium]|nr:hypothetical protein [Anaerolineales bacterium]
MPGAPRTADHFLSKFAVCGVYCAPEVVYRAAREAVEDAAADNIRYMELRFTQRHWDGQGVHLSRCGYVGV